jgi:hypothetical protein
MILHDIKYLLIELLTMLQSYGLFYEYGIIHTLSVIFFYVVALLFLARKDILPLAKKVITFDMVLCFILGGLTFFSYVIAINPEDTSLFYPATVGKSFNEVHVLSIIYGITCMICYKACDLLFGEDKRWATYLVTFAIMTSPLQIWVLYSSSIRDYLRAPILIMLFYLSVLIVKQEIPLNWKSSFLIGIFLVIAAAFRQEIPLYFPLFFMTFFISTNNSNYKRIFHSLIIISLVFLPGFLLLISSQESLERASHRYIPGLSEDVIRTYYGEPSLYVGPFNDLAAYVLTWHWGSDKDGSVYQFSQNVIFFYEMWMEYIKRVPSVIMHTFYLPATTNHYPPFFETTFLGGALEYIRNIFSISLLYWVGMVSFFASIAKNVRICLCVLFVIIYISLFNGLQFFHKNIFHLEYFIYVMCMYGICSLVYKAITLYTFYKIKYES